MSVRERVRLHANHVALYACMLVMPTAGYLAANFSKYGVKSSMQSCCRRGGTRTRRLYEFFKGMHRVTSWVFVALIALHVAAALIHLVRRDGIFARMWPGPSSR